MGEEGAMKIRHNTPERIVRSHLLPHSTLNCKISEGFTPIGTTTISG
jgi:hypothetical protein